MLGKLSCQNVITLDLIDGFTKTGELYLGDQSSVGPERKHLAWAYYLIMHPYQMTSMSLAKYTFCCMRTNYNCNCSNKNY